MTMIEPEGIILHVLILTLSVNPWPAVPLLSAVTDDVVLHVADRIGFGVHIPIRNTLLFIQSRYVWDMTTKTENFFNKFLTYLRS